MLASLGSNAVIETATVSGLTNGTADVFRVAAKTSYGVGSYATVGPLTPTP